MVKTLSKHGNSLALVIEKPILDLLGIDENTPIELTSKDGGLFLRKVAGDTLPDDFDAVVDRMNDRWAPVFKKLAE